MSDHTAPPPVQVVPPVQQPEPEPPKPLPGIPYPPFVILMAVVTLAAFIIGLTRFPGSYSLAVRHERARRLLEAGQPSGAVSILKPLVAQFPNSEDMRLELLEACERSNDLQGAVTELEWFEGRNVTKEEESRLNAVTADLESKLDAMEKKKK